MSRSTKPKNITEIRTFSKKDSNNIKNWLPSFEPPQPNEDFSSNYKNTFTLDGTNVIPKTGQIKGGSSKGEINQLTIFGKGTDETGKKYDNTALLEPFNLNRFYLFLYCLQNYPYLFPETNNIMTQSDTDVLMSRTLSKFLEEQQTSPTIKPFANGLVADSVRTYRSEKITSDIKDDKDLSSLLEFARTDQDYLNNVAGSLGKVTYDNIVKTTLYSILKKEGIISQKIRAGEAWDNEASKLPFGEFDYWIDPTGGTYSRGFPVICVFTNSDSKKTENDLIEKSNEFLSSKFFRKIGGQSGKSKDELVTVITKNKKPVGGEKYFIEIPNRKNAGYTYCFIYDFAKVIVLQQNVEQDYTLDLLKIGLSFLSRKRPKQVFNNKKEFITYYQAIKKYLESSYGESLEKQNFSILLKNKHAEECAYSLNKNKESFSAKFKTNFRVQLQEVLKSLDASYSKILDIFSQQTQKGDKRNFQFNNYPQNTEYPIILHYDNFYNLLAITSINNSPQEVTKEYSQNYPFIIEDYVVNFKYGELTKQFFNSKQNLPTIPSKTNPPTYDFIPNIGTNHDIVLITDVFLKQLYDILEQKKDSFVYENDENSKKDSVLKSDSINLLKEIFDRTKIALKKEDYFIISGDKINLKKDIVKKLSLDELIFSFDSVKETKIKFQTINKLLFINLEEEKKKSPTPDDFKDRIYYPILLIDNSPTVKVETKDPTGKDKNTDLLINNIISSELRCYEDIANSFDKAINAEEINDKLYYAFQSLVNIGLPILLSMLSEKIANTLKQLKKPGETLNPDLLDCLLADQDNLKKNIIGYLDLLLNLEDPKKLIFQAVPELPKLPNIPFFLTFDAEKELKRRLLKFAIDALLENLSLMLKKSIESMIDMCNADSYLTAFLTNAFPNDEEITGGVPTGGDKKGIASPSGYPVNSSNIYIPTITADINLLIQETGKETRENVYKYFRDIYKGKIPDKFDSTQSVYVEFTDVEISQFFSYLSVGIDAGELASLLKGTSTIQVRNVIVAYIKNYSNPNFSFFISNVADVVLLFDFLSLYIDYTLCYGIISSRLNNYSANVCTDTNSINSSFGNVFNQNSLIFGEDAVEDKIIELTKNLNELCELKNPLKIDLLGQGPSLLTNTLKKSLQAAVYSNIDAIKDLNKLLLQGVSQEDFKNKIQSDKNKTYENFQKKFGIIDVQGQDLIYKPFPVNEQFEKKLLYQKNYGDFAQKYINLDKFSELHQIIKIYLVSTKNVSVKSGSNNEKRFAYYMNKIINDYTNNYKQSFFSANIGIDDRITAIKTAFKKEINENQDLLKSNFLNKLNNSGNIGLKTELVAFDGYLRKLQQLKKEKVVVAKNIGL